MENTPDLPDIPPIILPPRSWQDPIVIRLEEIVSAPPETDFIIEELPEESEQSWEDRHLPSSTSVISRGPIEKDAPLVRMRCSPCDVAWSGRAESECWVCEEPGLGLRTLVRFRDNEHLDLELDFDF